MENNELPKVELLKTDEVPHYIEVNGREELTAELLFLQQNPSQEPVYLLFKNGDQRSLLEAAHGQLLHFDLNVRAANNAIKGGLADAREQGLTIKFNDVSLKHLLNVTDNGRNFGEGQLAEIPVNFPEQLAHAFEMIAAAKKEEALLNAQSAVPAGSSVSQLGLFAPRAGEKQPGAAQQKTDQESPKSKGNL